MPFACLQAQHRMRPEISVMMRPIYDNLMDHESVRNFETIKGINKNIFFVDHQEKEVKFYQIIVLYGNAALERLAFLYQAYYCRKNKVPKYQKYRYL